MLLENLKKMAWPTSFGLLLGFCILIYLSAQEHKDFSYAVKQAAPAVANIYTTKIVQQRHPLANDPLFQHFFNRNGRVKQHLAVSYTHLTLPTIYSV